MNAEVPKGVALDLSAGGAAGVIIVWSLETFVLADPVPGVVAVAIGTLAASIINRFFPNIGRRKP